MTTYTVAQAIAAANSGMPLTGAVILDSAADVQTNIDALQPLATAGEISTIGFTDQGTPKIYVTVTQNSNDMAAINLFQGQRTVVVTGATVAQAFAIQHQQHVAIAISDTGTNVESNIDAISNIANEIASITITDGTIPSFSASQLVNDSAVIGDIYVTGIDAAKAVANANAVLNIHGLVVTDSAHQISSNIDGLEALAAIGKLTSITLTDSGVATVNVSPAQMTADNGAIDTIHGLFVLAVDGSAANLTLNGPNGIANELILTGSSNQYSFQGGTDGKSFTITDTATGRQSTDHLSNFTAIQFDNGGNSLHNLALIASDTPTTAGAVTSAQVASLYASSLDRAPDAAGLVYYENEANSHPTYSALQFATQFVFSPEYLNNTANGYAQTTAGETQFITNTYQNLLHRAPEAGAAQWYLTNQINPGLAGLTPGTAAYTNADLQAHALVLASFSQSAEFRGDVTVTAQNPASASHWLILI